MSERLSRKDILRRLKAEYWRLKMTLAGLTPAQMLEPNVVGMWSIQDVMAHLVFWNRYVVAELEAALQGHQYEFDHSDQDAINAKAVALYADRSLEETLADFDSAYQAVVQVVESLPERAFEPDNPLEQALEDTISGALGNNTYDHYPIHEAQIRAWATAQRTRTYVWHDPMMSAKAGTKLAGIEYMHAMMRGELPPPPISLTLGFILLEAEIGRAVFGFQPAEFHYNPIGMVHGGLAATLLDSALGVAIHTSLAAGAGYTTVELHINLVRAITKETGYLFAEAKAIHVGRQMATAEARLTDGDGKLYAHGTTTCMVFSP
jgi:uncharacterized protein (TIGR00369 family)